MRRAYRPDMVFGVGLKRPHWLFVIGAALAVAAIITFLLPPMVGLMRATMFGALALFVGFRLSPSGSYLAAILAGMALGLGAAGMVVTGKIAEPIASTSLIAVYALAFAVPLLFALAWRPRGAMRPVDERSVTGRLLMRLAMIAMAVGFGGALAVTIDQAGERGASQRFQVELYARDIRQDHDGRIARELHVAAWGTQPATVFDVDAPTYDAVREGETICPHLHHGLLGIGWFRLAPCPAALRTPVERKPHSGEWHRDSIAVFLLMLLISVGLLAWAGGAVADGRIDGRSVTHTRRAEPGIFWFQIALLGGFGTLLLILATLLGLAMLT